MGRENAKSGVDARSRRHCPWRHAAARPQRQFLAAAPVSRAQTLSSSIVLGVCPRTGPPPGNVRELENAIERAVVLCPGGVIGLELLPDTVLAPDRAEVPIRLPENGATYKDLVEDYERRLVRTALRRTGGVQKRAAELLRMKPTTLHEIIKRLEIRDN